MMHADSATVFLLDDDRAVLTALGRLLRADGWRVEAFDSPRQFLETHDARVCGCLVLDYSMPACTGLDVQRFLAESGCDRPVIFLTGNADVPVTIRAMKGGAADFLLKPVDGGALLGAVRRAVERDRERRSERAAVAGHRARFESLTPREREVMELVVSGMLNKQIALRLGTVEKTVKVHRARVMEKLAVESLAELVRVATALGVGTLRVPPSPGAGA